MQFFWQDLRYGFRTLLRNPGFCAVAILALALGIGPNTAIFTMVNAVLLKPLPVPEPDRVVMIWGTLLKSGFDQMPVSAADYLEWKRQARSFDQMSVAFAIPEFGLNISGVGDPERVPAALASKEFLPALGIKPIVGRDFRPEEDRPGGPPAVLISHALWQRRFHSDPAAVGRTLTVDGIPRTVVGVVPHELGEMVAADLWLPTAINPNNPERGNHNYGVVARLKPGVTVAQARAEMTVIAKRLERAYPATDTGWGITLFPMAEMFTGQPPHPPVADREPRAGLGRRRAGTRPGNLERAADAQRGPRHVPHVATHACGRARAGIHFRHLDADRPAIRPGSRLEILARRSEHHAEGSRRTFGKRR
jgi:hypothetical protein